MAVGAMKIGFDDLLVGAGREAVFACEQVPLSSPLFNDARRREERRQERLRTEDTREDTDNNQGDTPDLWPSLEKEALHGLAADIVQTIAPHTEGDPVAVLLNTLAGFGNCITGAAHATVGKDRHPGKLDVVFVGETAKGRKGTAWSIRRYLFSLTDPDWVKDCIKHGLSSAEGLIYHVRDAVYKKQPVKEKGRVIDYEKVMIEEAVEDKRLDMVRKFEERRQVEVRTPLTVVPPQPSPESWPCPKCGREAEIEAVEPSLDGERMLTFWHCEPCQSYAVTPDTIKEPPKGWGTKREQ